MKNKNFCMLIDACCCKLSYGIPYDNFSSFFAELHSMIVTRCAHHSLPPIRSAARISAATLMETFDC